MWLITIVMYLISHITPITTHLNYCNLLYMEPRSFYCSKAQQPNYYLALTYGSTLFLFYSLCQAQGPDPARQVLKSGSWGRPGNRKGPTHGASSENGAWVAPS
uniref:Uncharacterized protein n=1 Tax=Micrurus corallinus TaxID=54390 RepID=A0A2D4GVE4_MICCO